LMRLVLSRASHLSIEPLAEDQTFNTWACMLKTILSHLRPETLWFLSLCYRVTQLQCVITVGSWISSWKNIISYLSLSLWTSVVRIIIGYLLYYLK
jgi:hypothetical protein